MAECDQVFGREVFQESVDVIRRDAGLHRPEDRFFEAQYRQLCLGLVRWPADEFVQGMLVLVVGAGACAVPEVVEDLAVGHAVDLA